MVLDAPASKVVALSAGECEIVYALGAGELVVGRGEYCNYPEAVLELPSVNSGAETNIEQILALEPDVIVMSKMAQTVEQVEALEAAGVRVVISDAQNLAGVYDAIAMLGELTGQTEKAEELATWCEETYAMMTDMMAKVDADGARKSLLYCLGDKGLNVIAKGSYHAETINLMSDNLADLPEVVSSGNGNEVDLEQIMVWNPDVIIFAPDTIYDTVSSDTAWQQLTAISSGNYYKTPYGPYGWLSSPPSVQRYLGMLWLGALLYPDYCEYDLQTEVTEYYKLFYQCDLTQEMYDNLMVGAMPAE